MITERRGLLKNLALCLGAAAVPVAVVAVAPIRKPLPEWTHAVGIAEWNALIRRVNELSRS